MKWNKATGQNLPGGLRLKKTLESPSYGVWRKGTGQSLEATVPPESLLLDLWAALWAMIRTAFLIAENVNAC